MENGKVKHKIGLFGVAAIAAGAVIGAGPMVLANAASATCGPAVWLAYIVIGLPMITVALSYAALASALPTTGGSYFFPTRIFSPYWGFLSGWAIWLGYITPLAVTAIAFADHLQAFLPFVPTVILSLILIGVFYILNALDIKISSLVQNILFSLLVIGLLFFSIKGLTTFHPAYMTPMQPFGFGATVQTAALLFFTYVGFTVAAELGDEVETSSKTIPRGMVLGIILCIVVYVLMSLAASSNLLWSDQAQSATPIYDAAKIVMPGLASFFVIIIITALATSQNGFQIAASRVMVTLGKDRVIPEKLGAINPRTGTPVNALTATILIALIFVFSGKGLIFACYCSNLCFLFSFVMVLISAILLPKRKPDLYEKAPFKLKGIWALVIPIIAIGVSIIFMALQEPIAMLWTLVWLLAGTLVYFMRKKQLAKEGIKLEEMLQRMPNEMEEITR